jgi:hypothetical protein
VSTRRALISKDDLDRMAFAVAAHGVVFKGRIDPLGGFTFTMEPPKGGAPVIGAADLGDEFADWASR